MHEVWAVSQGSYSDYMVHAVFEREEDAKEYVRLANTADARGYHERTRDNKQPIRSAFAHDEKQKHQGEFEDCAECKDRMEDHYYSMFVERFAFHPAGEIPHGDSNTESKP